MRKIKNLFAVSAMLVITLFSSCEKEESIPKTGEFDLTIDGVSYTGSGVTFSEKDEYFYSITIEDGIDFKMFVYRDSLDKYIKLSEREDTPLGSTLGILSYKDKEKIYGPDEASVNIITTSINLGSNTYPWGLASNKYDVKFISKKEIVLDNCRFNKFDVETNNYIRNYVTVSGTIKY